MRRLTNQSGSPHIFSATLSGSRCDFCMSARSHVNRTSLRDLLRGQASGHVILFRVRSNRYNVRYSTSFPSSHKHLLSDLESAFKLNTTDDLADVSELNKTT